MTVRRPGKHLRTIGICPHVDVVFHFCFFFPKVVSRSFGPKGQYDCPKRTVRRPFRCGSGVPMGELGGGCYCWKKCKEISPPNCCQWSYSLLYRVKYGLLGAPTPSADIPLLKVDAETTSEKWLKKNICCLKFPFQITCRNYQKFGNHMFANLKWNLKIWFMERD